MALEAMEYDLLIVVDATYSMEDYLVSLSVSLPKIISISSLTDCFTRIGLIAYRDYCDTKLVEWSGWVDGTDSGTSSAELLRIARNLEPIGGGDLPEATKTGLAKAYEIMREDATTLILLYTDAAPHVDATGDQRDPSCLHRAEQRALLDTKSYGGYGPHFADWVSACSTLHTGPKKAQVFCFLDGTWEYELYGYYNYLTKVTRGCCMYMENKNPGSISQVTVEVLLAWMGVEKTGTAQLSLPARMSRYIDIAGFKTVKKETDEANNKFFIAKPTKTPRTSPMWNNLASTQVTSAILKGHLPKRKGTMQDFAKRYAADDAYKSLVTRQLKELISTDVIAISINAVFGTLWRAVCNDRANSERDALITAFGYEIDRIDNADEKERMKRWLEESYDYTAEVLDAIAAVPSEKRFPCVLLDPTLRFTVEAANDDDAARPITEFQRDELLEIGRSCDYRILRRLGKVLTRFTFINSAADMPEHIASTEDKDVPKIPMALVEAEFGRRFWKILLHLIVPGTMLAARPAALLAALTLKLGVQPLVQPAVRELNPWRTRWNNLDIPETWNVSCLALIMDADAAYRAMDAGSRTAAMPQDLLPDDDQSLFDRLVSYKMLELNMNTDLTAKVAWTPDKTMLPIGPLVVCSGCNFPRSITIMASHGRCGLCAFKDYTSEQERKDNILYNASKESNESSIACWVECFDRACRAQYVVYNTHHLNVRAKCHYCRLRTGEVGNSDGAMSFAPCLECHKCGNKVIWPENYRHLAPAQFECVACSAGRKTIVEEITTAKLLAKDNGDIWLLRNEDKIKEPFSGRSVFHTISTAGTDSFCDKVEVLPVITGSALSLTIKGKPVFNALDVRASLQSWITRRRTESGTCSLCFSDVRKTDLNPACGRSGCHQRICTTCLKSWYEQNAYGHLINVAALHCPFCRRAPAPKTLGKYSLGVGTLPDLKRAIDERGNWIYGWCIDCDSARRFVPRVCARGAPAEMTNFLCERCTTRREEIAARQAADRRRREMAVESLLKNAADSWKQEESFDPVESIKMCPGCGVATRRTYGCNHMTCVCGQHWCYCCGRAGHSAEAVYDHFADEHSGYFRDRTEEDEDD